MLRTRVISSLIGLMLLFAVVLSGKYVLGAALFVIALVGMHEFYNAVESAGYKPIRIVGYVSCLPIFFIGLNGSIGRIDTYIDLFKSINYFSFGLFVIIIILFSISIFKHDIYNLNDIALTVFGIFYVAFLFSFLVLARNLKHGSYFIWLVFIGWATDIFAYFAGRSFGKNKILPSVSPNKTVEGAIGGVVGCVIATLLYGLFLNQRNLIEPNIPIFHYVIIGILNGTLSQLGDWSASSIKRYVKIKDYGKIMPGHGGVLDRFDSILFVAPVVYFYISFIILK